MTTMHDHRPTAAPRIGLEEAATVLLRNEALFIDVRTPEEYRFSHAPGAVNLPLLELPQRLQGLPKERPIVTYCT
jgi:rhodanese-related sulfurtransferase